MKKNSVLDIKIQDMGLSVRTYNCLRRASFKTVRDILIYCADDVKKLNKIRNMGQVSVEELKNVIKALGEQNGEILYVGMPLEDVEHYGLSEDEITKYEEDKKSENTKKQQRELFLSTSLESLGINSKLYFSDFSYSVNTLGQMLHLLADKNLHNRINNLNLLKEEISELEFPNIYFGMTEEEIDNIYVSDEILSLLSLVIQFTVIKKNKRMDNEALSAQKRIRENIDNILIATQNAKKRNRSIMADLAKSRKLADELAAILKEQDELSRQVLALDSKIEGLLGETNGNRRKFY